MVNKIKLNAKQLDDMAIQYLSGNYEEGYVKSILKKKIKIKEWELIIQSYKAGVYGLLSRIKKDPKLLQSIIDSNGK